MGAVILLSGGMDSAVAAFWAREELGDPIYCLSIEYGQRHWVELEAAKRVAGQIRPKAHAEVNFGPRGVGFGSMLTAKKGTITEKGSVVPARNVFFLGAAAVYAVANDCSTVVIGSCLEDQGGYLDCRPDTIEAAARAYSLALGTTLTFVAPFATVPKRGIVKLAHEYGPRAVKALERSWSCYDPQPSKPGKERRCNEVVPCEACPACVKREEAFRDV